MEELTSLSDLLDLQAVDLEIDRLIHRRETLPELATRSRLEEEMAATDARIESLKGELHPVVAAIDRTEDELVLLTEKGEREEKRLYAGAMSAREATHMRDEVEMIRRQISDKEDSLLELMEARERHEAGLAGLQTERAELASRHAEVQGRIDEEWRAIDVELGRKESRKADLVPLVPEDLLGLYERLRPTKPGGVAVGTFVEGFCGACHIKLSPGEQAEVLAADPPRCVHCRCIVVA